MPLTRRRLLTSVLPAAGMAAAGLGGVRPAWAQTQDPLFFRIGTGTTGGTYFPIGGIIAGAISGPPGLPPCGSAGGSCGVAGLIAVAQASAGSIDNIRRIRDGEFDSGLSQADVAFAAYAGEGPFAGQPPVTSLRAIAHLFSEFVHVVVPADSPIQSVADLKGKRVSVGAEGSGTIYDIRLILAAYGLKQTDVTEVYERPEPSADLLAEGGLDAMVMTGGPPLGVIADLARRRPIRLLPITGPETEALIAKVPFFALEPIPAGLYDGVAAEVPALSVGAIWLVAERIEEATVYEITRALWQKSTLDLLAAGHARGKEVALEGATRGLGVPLHPGAARYYAEHAMLSLPTRATP
ncbi:TAXI family TRAP transporter solute-binding subunit [Inquilinus sp. CA228]|uniref:TAXI family TRAP transporter solute-binding subunit n=1 Tax=Inquilinus sp. CA228 TaxID=3455609 RepID=UPI003F8D4365